MNQKNNISPIVNKLIPICLSCNSIPLFLSLTHTSQYDIIFNYKCKCSSDRSVILSQYLENLFIYTKILLFKCFCEKRASYDCSKCDLYICDKCLAVHLNHLVFLIKTILPKNICKTHRIINNHYCRKCNKKICDKCVIIAHSKHKTISFEKYYDEVKWKTSSFLYHFERNVKSITESLPENKRIKAYNEINALFSFYVNGYKYSKIIRNFNLIHSLLAIKECSIKNTTTKLIQYNKLPHLFMCNYYINIKEKIDNIMINSMVTLFYN